MNQPFNIQQEFKNITEYWSPRVLSETNGQYIKIAKVKGDFVWHDHFNEDEFFFIIKGILTIEMKNETIQLHEGEGFVVPKGCLHKPNAKEECWLMLIEPKATLHTGQVKTPYSRKIEDQLP